MSEHFEGLGDDIVAMREDRRGSIGTIKRECKESLGECRKDNAGLKAEVAQQKSRTQEFVSDLHGQNQVLKAEAEQIASDFRTESGERHASWQGALRTISGGAKSARPAVATVKAEPTAKASKKAPRKKAASANAKKTARKRRK